MIGAYLIHLRCVFGKTTLILQPIPFLRLYFHFSESKNKWNSNRNGYAEHLQSFHGLRARNEIGNFPHSLGMNVIKTNENCSNCHRRRRRRRFQVRGYPLFYPINCGSTYIYMRRVRCACAVYLE